LTLLGRLAGASTTLAWKPSAGCQGVRSTEANRATGRKEDEGDSTDKGPRWTPPQHHKIGAEDNFSLRV